MKTIRLSQKTDKNGALSLVIPLGEPDQEYEVIVVLEPKPPSQTPEEGGWPPGYFDLAGSIDDATFQRPAQGEFPKPVEFD